MNVNRRVFFAGLTGSAAAIFLNSLTAENLLAVSSENKKPDEPEVAATEDLMREHGVLRRALFIYDQSADRLISDPEKVSTDALNKTAKLFRAFGEDYHEKKLEEAYIFPALKRRNSSAAVYVDTLIAQHNRGRQITDYIIAATKTPKLQESDARYLAKVLKSMVRMYTPHADIEDTVVFPAWKEAIGIKELDEMGEKFEAIEHQQFGEDGFEKAVKQIADIEAQLGMSDLSSFTAPSPKK